MLLLSHQRTDNENSWMRKSSARRRKSNFLEQDNVRREVAPLTDLTEGKVAMTARCSLRALALVRVLFFLSFSVFIRRSSVCIFRDPPLVG